MIAQRRGSSPRPFSQRRTSTVPNDHCPLRQCRYQLTACAAAPPRCRLPAAHERRGVPGVTAVTLPIRGLIFDFDGLILDTETPSLQAWEELYQGHGGDFPFARWAMNIGTDGTVFDSHAELERQCGRVLDREALRDRRRRRTNDLIALAAVLPGVVEFLDAAADVGLRAAVASSSPRQWVDGHLDRLGLLERFLCTVCAEDVPRVKPD